MENFFFLFSVQFVHFSKIVLQISHLIVQKYPIILFIVADYCPKVSFICLNFFTISSFGRSERASIHPNMAAPPKWNVRNKEIFATVTPPSA